MKRAIAILLLTLSASCATEGEAPSVTETIGPSTAPSTTTPAVTAAPTNPPTTTTAPTTTSTGAATSAAPSTTIGPRPVTTGGEYNEPLLAIQLSFVSEVDDVATSDLEEIALTILNDPSGWIRSGFTFSADASSELMVILADGARVDELCLPLETYGKVSCQNGNIVALNADRWRLAGDDWDSTIDDYRTYLINHEVGHLIGLRHPLERCPSDSRISALMEPQTNNLQDCTGNGIPLDWEVEWAQRRPAVVGPDPDWAGPRPSWPPNL